VVVIATTTNISLLDKALTRPGRLELHIRLDLPDESQRKLLLQYEVKKLQCNSDAKKREAKEGASENGEEEELDRVAAVVARDTQGYSPAQLKQLVQEATMAVLRDTLPNNSAHMTPFLHNARSAVINKIAKIWHV
jgi:ATP-dependent 26S proteasome regulatory subunit